MFPILRKETGRKLEAIRKGTGPDASNGTFGVPAGPQKYEK